ncbi:unnamed protein product, partial [Symbiodinium microadriaticum]
DRADVRHLPDRKLGRLQLRICHRVRRLVRPGCGIFELLLCQRAGRLLLVGYPSPPTDD